MSRTDTVPRWQQLPPVLRLDRTRSRVVVVVVYNEAPDLARAIASLGPDEQFVVVDNASDPDARRVAEGAGACYLDAGGNRGYAAAVNVALSAIGAVGPSDRPRPDVLLLNADARVTSATLDAMQDEFDRPGNERLAAVSPQLCGLDDGEDHQVGWPFPTPLSPWIEAAGLRRFDRRQQFVVGPVLLLRAEALADVGYLDERYFIYAVETDWQRRAHDRGWVNRCVEGLWAEHQGGATNPNVVRRERLLFAGQETYVRRWHGNAGWTIFRLGGFVGQGVRGLFRGGEEGAHARRRAADFLRGPRRMAGMDAVRPPTTATSMRGRGIAAGVSQVLVEQPGR